MWDVCLLVVSTCVRISGYVRYEKKMTEDHRVADENGFLFVPAVFLHTGQIHESIKRLITEQIRHKLLPLEDEAKQSKVKSTMKWWSKMYLYIYSDS